MHTHFSHDSEMAPEQLVKRCEEVGLNCVAVTDHNTIKGALAVRELASFIVIIGEEVASSEGEITGLFLSEEVPRDLTPLETAKRIKDQGGLVSIPHPFDRFRRGVISAHALETVLPYADIVEIFNSRNNLARDDRKATKFARDNGLLVSGVSDAHTTKELGRTYLRMPEFDGSPENFKKALSKATIVGRRSGPLVHVKTSLIKLRKRLKGNHP